VPAQLPACPPGFVGRDDQLKRLDDLAEADGAPSRLAAIIGPAGVGKTTLAVYWAHRQRQRFPDGQLYVNLHGFHPSGEITPGGRGDPRIPGGAAHPAGGHPDRRGRAGRAVPQHGRRAPDARRARQRPRHRTGTAAAARLAGLPHRRDQPAPAHRAGRV
jgi:hypothetical protein